MPTNPARSTDPRFFDFDAAFAEVEGATIPFKLMGKVWEVPGTVDATVILRIQRLMLAIGKMEETGEPPEDLVIDDDLSYEAMCRNMVGDELMDTWLTHRWNDQHGRKRTGPSYEMLQAVSRRLFSIHTGNDPDAVASPGEPKRPADHKAPAKAGSGRSAAKKSSPRRR